MSRAMSVTFLGTSSGGGPSASRNCSSLVGEFTGDGFSWMVDCAEGTVRQYALQPSNQRENRLKPGKVNKMFITHMHADHIMGIIPFLRSTLFAPPTDVVQVRPTTRPRIEIFGPAGLRTFVRSIMKMTLTKTADRYVVHELLRPDDPITSCAAEELHFNEAIGEDIISNAEGFWEEFTKGPGVFCDVVVDAGPISHRDPCLGFVIRETAAPARKIVILGDTYDPSGIIPLATNPAPSLLVHEATDSYIPTNVDPSARRAPDVVHAKAIARGHSTPLMAGAFAKLVGAQKLVLNHIGARFPAPAYSSGPRDVRAAVLREIERQATEAWGTGNSGPRAMAAWDYMRVVIPAPEDAFPPSLWRENDPALESGSGFGEGAGGREYSQRGYNGNQYRDKRRRY